MGLIVFDMGRRIETPVEGPRRRVRATSAISPAADLHKNEPTGTFNSLTYSPDGHREQKQHTPQAVAYAGDIMEVQVITIPDDATIEQAYGRMQKHGIHHLPLVNQEGVPVAMVSDRSLLRALAEGTQQMSSPLLNIATRPVYCVLDSTDIRQTARLLCDYHIGALPVINNEQRLTGIITRTDLLRLLSDYGPLELWA